jgi:hypothetical protein
LRELFEREHRQLSPQPFLEIVEARIAKARARAKLASRIWQAAALAAVAIGSPWLISGSVLLSARLGTWFAVAEAWFSTPGGTAGAAACLLAVLVWGRRSLL